MFNGHLDTVPPFAMKNPFEAKVINDKIRGRGTADMKGALAAMIAVMLGVQRSGLKLCGELIFTGTIGEETYSHGAAHLLGSGQRADFIIVGEPTELQPCVAHKGVLRVEVVFVGHEAHGSAPEQGINAIYKASQWINAIENEYLPRLVEIIHPLLGRPTLNVGTINGGTGAAIVPNRCSVVIDYRILPGQSRKTVLNELRHTLVSFAQKDPTFKAELKEMNTFHNVPHDAFEASSDSQLVKLLCTAYQEEFGRQTTPAGCPFWTDAALFAQIPQAQVIVCGPGNIAQAHSNDEYIERRQLWAAWRIYSRLAVALCAAFCK